jgi:predicted MPP superfamily phosphohydrolase
MRSFRVLRSPRSRVVLLVVAIALLGALDACWFETRVLLLEDSVRLPLIAPRLRVVHLSDLHVAGDSPLLHQLLRRVAAARPDLIAVSGDLISDVQDPRPQARHTAAAAAFISQLRRLAAPAPIYAVQGHSEYQGEVVVALRRAGITWLSDEGRRVGPGGSLLLLGLNQQVGIDRLALAGQPPFRLIRQGGQWLHMARLASPVRNFYLHYDPAPRSRDDGTGPLAWSGYDALCDVRIDQEQTGAGIEVHSRYVLGEDRMIRLRRMSREDDGKGTFSLLLHGSAFTGGAADHLDTGVVPRPGRWYRLRLRTRVEAAVVRVAARAWPADQPEPATWQAWAEDRSADRVTAGTVGIWAWGGGTVLYRGLQAIAPDGRQLLADPLSGPLRPRGWRDEARGTRLQLALARSPVVPLGTPRMVLSHTPDVVLEASQGGIEAVLAGHTHGGQVRLPFVGAITTRSSLGPHYDYGLFDFAAPNQRGITTLFINAGVGTSLLPLRFFCPPRYAVIELGR